MTTLSRKQGGVAHESLLLERHHPSPDFEQPEEERQYAS